MRLQLRVARAGVEASLMFAAVLFGLWVLWWTRNADSAGVVGSPRAADYSGRVVSLKDVPRMGDVRAPLALIEYCDFRCPFCGRYTREVFPTLVREYVTRGRLLVAFISCPLERFHPGAASAATAAECAERQGRFWQMHDALFAATNPDRIDVDVVSRRVIPDFVAYMACRTDVRTVDGIRRRQEQAAAIGVSSTPTFLIGRHDRGTVRVSRSIVGALPYSVFSAVLDAAIVPMPAGPLK